MRFGAILKETIKLYVIVTIYFTGFIVKVLLTFLFFVNFIIVLSIGSNDFIFSGHSINTQLSE